MPDLDPNGTDGVLDDGDWTVAYACTAPRLEYPFEDKGDSFTFIVRQRFQQAASSFIKMADLTPHPVYPSALLVEEGPQQNLGGGKIEWERVWACVPITRTEHESFVYPFQTLVVASTNDNGAVSSTGTLGTLALTVASTVTYQYDIAANIVANLPLSIAPRVYEVATNDFVKLGTGSLYLSGAFVCSHDDQILAENDTYGDWKGLILCRKRRQIAGPTPAFWGTSLNLSANAAPTTTGTGSGGGGGGTGTPVTSKVPVNFAVSPTSVLPGSTTTLTLTNLETAYPWDTIVEPTFSTTVGSVGEQGVTGPNSATVAYTAPSTPGQCVLTAIAESGIPWGIAGLTVLTVPLFTVSPASVLANSITPITLTGNGTSWAAGETFSAAAGTISQVVVNTDQQTATATYTAPAVLGPVNLTTTRDPSAGSLAVTLF